MVRSEPDGIAADARLPETRFASSTGTYPTPSGHRYFGLSEIRRCEQLPLRHWSDHDDRRDLVVGGRVDRGESGDAGSDQCHGCHQDQCPTITSSDRWPDGRPNGRRRPRPCGRSPCGSTSGHHFCRCRHESEPMNGDCWYPIPSDAVLTLSTWTTRSGAVLDVYRVGRLPPPGTPVELHDTDHSTVAVTTYAPSSGLPSSCQLSRRGVLVIV